MGHFGDTLRYGQRTLRKSWGFSLAVVLTLALGIGVNTLVYSIVDSVILNPFPFPQPDRLVGIGSEWPQLSRDLGFFETLSPAEYMDVKAQAMTLEDVVMWDMGFRAVSTGVEQPEMLLSAFWFDDVFPTLGVSPILGRGFSPGELERGDQVAIISYRLWQTRLGARSDALGHLIQVDGVPYTVIGVMSPRAQLLASDLWIPMGAGPTRFPRNARRMEMLARIREGYTLAEVNTELATISRRVEQEYGDEFEEYTGWQLRALTWTEVNVRLVKPIAFGVMSVVGFVMLVVCANVANLLLAKSASRRREIAVCSALGASRARLVGQMLTESLILAALGAALAVALTQITVATVLPRLIARIPFLAIEVSLNHRVLLFTVLAAAVSGLVLGLAPALQATGSGLQGSLKADAAGVIGRMGRRRLQGVFVGAQFTVALLLLAQAGLMTNSLLRMQGVDPGFDVSKSLTMRLTLPGHRYPDRASTNAFFQLLIERVEALPGVRKAAAGSSYPPLLLPRRQGFTVEGEVYLADADVPSAIFTGITHGYHEALGIPLVQGRTFTAADTPQTPRVAVINEAAARRHFPDRDAIGRRFRVGGPEQPWVEVVGVVRSVHNLGPERDPQPELFVNVQQNAWSSQQLFLIVRTETDPRGFLDLVQAQVRSIDPDQSVYAVATVGDTFAAITAPRRLGTIVLMILAGFALALAATGIYAVVSLSVTERTREIGVRLALGSTSLGVRRLVVRQSMRPVLVGGALGLLLAIASGRAMASFLFDVSATDPLTLGVVTLVLVASATAASYLPALRASRLDPTVALRDE